MSFAAKSSGPVSAFGAGPRGAGGDEALVNGRRHGAFALSVALHAGVAVLLLGAGWMLRTRIEPEKPFVVVAPPAGAGEDRVGDALLSDAGAAQAGPVDFRAEMRERLRAEARRTEREIARMREASRQAEAERARREAVQQTQAQAETSEKNGAVSRPTSYEAFRRENPLAREPSVATSRERASSDGGTSRVRVDARDAIARTSDGAGGPGRGAATVARPAQGSDAVVNAMERYWGDMVASLRDSHRKPEGLGDLLSAEVRFTLAADGAVSRVEIVRSSGNADFDRSVLEAFARVRLPARPDGKTDVQRLTFRMQEL